MGHKPLYSEAEIEAALEACAHEPVHVPGAIQPMGCLVSLDADMGRIRQVSANIEDFVGISVADILAGEPRQMLRQVFGVESDVILDPRRGTPLCLPYAAYSGGSDPGSDL
ncbi:hypothetical protein QC823_13930 [Halomonas vilamensis]|uniref:PAS fold-2 domain-containing protein n=1 Tax=Vreelandella vilamensis TaxID=531309 RepID=A0ABU1H705_9GAMM|nr:hypothetical protein [Halomonas vilamensis]MDR5900080.1 hypothetical protein [Halomonas vilamensis]